jgi:hypothetical protein
MCELWDVFVSVIILWYRPQAEPRSGSLVDENTILFSNSTSSDYFDLPIPLPATRNTPLLKQKESDLRTRNVLQQQQQQQPWLAFL